MRVRRKPDRFQDYSNYGEVNMDVVRFQYASCCVFMIEPEFAIVTDVEVQHRHQKKGYGTRLVDKVKKAYASKRLFFSSVPESEGFWQKMGCREVGFNELPCVVRSRLDIWQHKNYKQFEMNA